MKQPNVIKVIVGSQSADNLVCIPGLPERRLLSAILERAIADALPSSQLIAAHGETPEGITESAWSWLRADRSRAPAVWSFAWVCQHLEFDPGMILAVLEARRKRERPFYRERDARKKASQARRGSLA